MSNEKKKLVLRPKVKAPKVTKEPSNVELVWQPKVKAPKVTKEPEVPKAPKVTKDPIQLLNVEFKRPHFLGMGKNQASDTAYMVLQEKPLCVFYQYYFPVSNYYEKNDPTMYSVEVLDPAYEAVIKEYVDPNSNQYVLRVKLERLGPLLTHLMSLGAKFVPLADNAITLINDHGYG